MNIGDEIVHFKVVSFRMAAMDELVGGFSSVFAGYWHRRCRLSKQHRQYPCPTAIFVDVVECSGLWVSSR
jgi:hypothetical protein